MSLRQDEMELPLPEYKKIALEEKKGEEKAKIEDQER